jgi:hypothetical protein
VAASSLPALPAALRRIVLPSAGIFGPASEWRRDVSDAPLATDSRALVDNLAQQVSSAYGGVAAFNVWDYNVSVAIAGPHQPGQDVIFDDCQGKGYVPAQLTDPSEGAPFVDVPVPPQAAAAAGTDGELSVWQPSTDTLWELWKAHQESDGWHACWGGRIDHVSDSPGYFPGPTGVAATGLSVTGGAIGIAEGEDGVIDHAMSLVVRSAARSSFSYPARRTDGDATPGPGVFVEGQRFRLDPSLDVDRLGLTPLGAVVARAAQRYGFIVTDKGGSVSLVAESGAPAQTATGTNPWKKILGNVPGYGMLRGFPWDKLQALPLDYGGP